MKIRNGWGFWFQYYNATVRIWNNQSTLLYKSCLFGIPVAALVVWRYHHVFRRYSLFFIPIQLWIVECVSGALLFRLTREGKRVGSYPGPGVVVKSTRAIMPHQAFPSLILVGKGVRLIFYNGIVSIGLCVIFKLWTIDTRACFFIIRNTTWIKLIRQLLLCAHSLLFQNSFHHSHLHLKENHHKKHHNYDDNNDQWAATITIIISSWSFSVEIY